ncbi:MAG: 2-oxo acid dehydrogenase subunit E2 [Porticoccaceae bacterium]|nr:2-oxo acid dehydrogenase subunit E2 [Porticoccaceae bacterium]
MIVVPDLGGVDRVEVIEFSLMPGQTLGVDDAVVVLESDKASMDVPSPVSGILQRYLVAEGDSVAVGDALAEIAVGSATTSSDNGSDEPSSEPTKLHDQPIETAASSEQSTAIERLLRVPDTGGDSALEVIEVTVAVGDTIAEGETLVVLESDKATIDVPASESGSILEILVAEADKVTSGTALVRVATNAEVPAVDAALTIPEPSPAKNQSVVDSEAAVSVATGTVAVTPLVPSATALSAVMSGASEVYAGPAVRLLARELGVDLTLVTGSGARGRISRDDLNEFVKQRMEQASNPSQSISSVGWKVEDFAEFGALKSHKMSNIQRLTASAMHASWEAVPRVTQFDEADITELDAFRQSLGDEGQRRAVKLSPVAFIVKAVALTLQAHPVFNRSLIDDGSSYVQKHYCHIGLAVDTPRGLLVPVVRDVDQKGLWQLAGEITELAGKAKEGKLTPAEMRGGCFTVSSLGALGGLGFTPIVNTPEVGILGVAKAQIKPHWDGTAFQPRLFMPLSLSYDHRLINGADGGRFMLHLVTLLSDIRHLALG